MLAWISHSPRRFRAGLAAIVLVFATLRWPLLDACMERDEGEYAAIGLGILHGVPPYREAYTMKLPGAASLHAVIFWLMGPTAHSIHLALLGINGVTIALVGLLGRRLMGTAAGLFAAAAYGTFTIGTGMFGFWLSAEHFGALFLMAGACVTPLSLEKGGSIRAAAGALLLGTAMVIKHHAAFPAAAWLIANGWVLLGRRNGFSGATRAMTAIAMILAFVFPVGLTVAIMAWCGVFEKFRFWTMTYAFQYASAVPLSIGWEYLKIGGAQVFRDAPLLWILAAIGFGMLMREWFFRGRSSLPSGLCRGEAPALLIPATIGGAAAASAGLLFRGQYFILLAPFAALLAGLAWQQLLSRLQTSGNASRFSALSAPLRTGAAMALSLGCFAGLFKPLIWGLTRNPEEISRMVYGMNPFPEYAAVAEYVRQHTRPEDKAAVIGSEPAIYFLADRRPATPYLCVYEMMKPHAFANRMQQEAIRCIEQSRPRCVVLVSLDISTSWGVTPRSDPTFFRWLEPWLRAHYTLNGVADLISERETVFRWDAAARSYRPKSPYILLVFLRKEQL
ncbi:MAG: hypothetical protein HY360_11115 [Verrucomicrobia bacterium]|nr:hypothetical protein [Verrucomicrobiota bacterium]